MTQCNTPWFCLCCRRWLRNYLRLSNSLGEYALYVCVYSSSRHLSANIPVVSRSFCCQQCSRDNEDTDNFWHAKFTSFGQISSSRITLSYANSFWSICTPFFFHNGDTRFLPSNHAQRPLCLLHSRWHLMFGKHGVCPSGQMCCGSPYAAMGRAQLSATYLEDGSLNTVGSRGTWTEAWIMELFRGNSQAFILLESRKHCRRLQ